MADVLVTLGVRDMEAEGDSIIGRVLNVYDTYANALSYGATGLSTIYDVDVLTGLKGSAITQVAKTTGVTVDNNGIAKFFAANGGGSQEYFIRVGYSEGPAGRESGPRRIIVQ